MLCSRLLLSTAADSSTKTSVNIPTAEMLDGALNYEQDEHCSLLTLS